MEKVWTVLVFAKFECYFNLPYVDFIMGLILLDLDMSIFSMEFWTIRTDRFMGIRSVGLRTRAGVGLEAWGRGERGDLGP